MGEVQIPDEPVIYRAEVTAIIGWMTDVLTEIRAIRDAIEGDDGEEEEEN